MMTFIQNIEKICEHYKFSNKERTDIELAICAYDDMHGENNKELTVDKWLNPNRTIPRVQLKRVYCDTITILLNKNGITDKNNTLTMQSSCGVAKLLGLSKKVTLGTDYATEIECDEIMSRLLSFDEDESEFSDLFEYISETLGRIKEYDKFYKIAQTYSFEKVYLPEKYDNHGFKVSNEMTVDLKKINSVERYAIMELIFCAEFVNAYIWYLQSGTNNMSAYQELKYSSRYTILNSKHFTIGVGVVSPTVPDIKYKPLSGGYKYILGYIFNKNYTLSRQSVESLFVSFDYLKEGGFY